MEEKLPKPCLTDYDLLIGQDLWQAHDEILLIILLKELGTLVKYKYGHDNKRCETCGIKYKNLEYCIEYTSVKDDLIKKSW